jgi:hypothetical protein
VIAVGRRDQDYKFLPSRSIQRQHSFLKKLKRNYNDYTVKTRAILIERIQYDYILLYNEKRALDSQLSASFFYL